MKLTTGPHMPSQSVRGASKAGFSLLELILTASILLILATLYYGGTSSNRQAKMMSQCQANLQGLFMALEIYSREHKGSFPAVPGAASAEEALQSLVPRYTSETKYLVCPAAGTPAPQVGKPLAKQRISYAYFMGRTTGVSVPLVSDAVASTNARRQGDLLFSFTGQAPGNNHQKSGGNLLFTDGQVKLSAPRAEFDLAVSNSIALVNPHP